MNDSESPLALAKGVWRLFGIGAMAALAGMFGAGSLAQTGWAAPEVIVLSDETKHAGEFVIPVNKSQVLRVDQPLKDLLVGNAEIADVLALTDRSVYVLGKSLGSTSLTLYGDQKELIAVIDLVVSPDVEGLKARYFEVMPKERVEVRPVNNGLMLSGTVTDAGKVSKAVAIAERYAGGGNITNLLSVMGSQQVMLKVKFAELSRTAGKELGLNFQVVGNDFNIISGDTILNKAATPAFGGIFDTVTALGTNTFTAGLANFDIGSTSFNFLYEALEQKGVVKTLAEPNLIALSGDTASFLAGGEFPIPVEEDDSITIEFREFGVSLSFTPTVLEDDLINLVLTTEVSAIDQSLTSLVAGVGVPGLATNRTTTTVELRDGQSFAISGLLQDDFQDTVRQFPYLGDIPVLGALFRSTDYQRSESELVVAITVHRVQPAPAGTIVTPADRFVPPSDADLFLFGRTEAPESGLGTSAAGYSLTGQATPAGEDDGAAAGSSQPALAGPDSGVLAAQRAGGIQGTYGHIIK